MIALISVLALGRFAPTTLFDQCVNNLRKLGPYSVHITVKASGSGKVQITDFDLAVKGADALLRVREPATSVMDHSDRSYRLVGDKLVAYDAVAKERLQRVVKGQAPIESRLSGVLGQLDGAVLMALSPNLLGSFFARFRGATDWSVKRNGGIVSIGRYTNKSANLFKFSERTGLLREVWANQKGAQLDWAFEFKSGADLTLNVPRSANLVTSFTVREAPPKFVNGEAKKVATEMQEAYRTLKYGTIHVQSGKVQTTLYISDKRLREDRPNFSWAFDGSTLDILNRKTGKFYSGKAIRVLLSEYITKVGGEVDPILLRIMAHKVPYQDLFPRGGVVRLVGSAGPGWKKSDILDITSPTLKVSAFVRQVNHLLDSVSSETVDRPGRIQTRSERYFTYEGLGSPPSRELFRLNNGGVKVLPLPKIEGDIPKTKRQN